MAWHIEQSLDELEISRQDSGLILDKDALERSIKGCLPRFKDHALLKAFPMDTIMNAVACAWSGYFGELPLLEDDPDYSVWERRVLAMGGRILCPVCRIYMPIGMRYCGNCGRELPDMYFFEKDENVALDVARYQLAVDRKCDPKDIPCTDVKDRLPYIDSYAAQYTDY